MENEIIDTENFLNNLPKKGGFKVPENYFETLNASLAEKVNDQSVKTIKLSWINPANLTSIAASMLLIAGFFMFDPKFKSSEEPDEEEIISHLQTEELTVDLLCDAGWCIDLDQTEQKNTELEDEILRETETELILTEL
jgi:hypothetical protein